MPLKQETKPDPTILIVKRKRILLVISIHSNDKIKIADLFLRVY